MNRLGLIGILAALGISSVWGADLKTLPGHVPRELSALKATGVVASTNQLRLAIGVPLRNPAGLDEFLTQLYDPASPNYRHYLTPQEFTDRFGPTVASYEAVKQFARTNGLTVVGTHDNRLVLDVLGPAAAVEKAFHLTLQTYSHPTEGRQCFAPDVEPAVDAQLPVADVQGLSDFYRPHPHIRKANSTASPKDGSGSGGAYLGDDFRNAYAAGTTLTGAGQMVGLLQFDGFYASDITAYAQAAGGGRANIAIQTVLLDGYDGVPTTGPNSGNGEVSLDIEMAMAMAPGLSKIVVFEAGPYGFQNDVLNSMAANSSIKNLSCSWGWNGPSTTTDNIFKTLAAQGQSFFNASGDSDAFTVGASSANGVDNPSLANAPSSSPYITQVGGTTLTMSGSGAAFASETVWNWGGGTGSGGGVSSYYSIPAWQSGISMTANLGSSTQRNIPDVAMAADNVYVAYGSGSTDVFGGTSCAAPLWAGFMALVNQRAASLGNAAPGLVNTAIYAIGKGKNATYSYSACFHDITTGNNEWSGSPSQYPAVAGYDLCTGWGTPNGASLIAALAGTANTVPAATATLGVGPQTGLTFTGSVGGPFTPATATLQLTNSSSVPLTWKISSQPAWLAPGATSGALAANAVTSLTVGLASTAQAFKAGNYSATLSFSNLTAQTAQSIPVTLQVYAPMSVTPSNFAATGPVRGPFVPNSQTFALTNFSGNTIKWGLVKTATWLAAASSSGTLSAYSQTNVTVSLSASASVLRAAVYNTSITFTNSAGTVVSVPCSLSVGQPLVQNGGFETGSFSGWTQSGNTTYTSVSGRNAAYVHGGAYGAQLGPSGSPGYLSQTVPTAAGQTYLLSLWLRNATGATPNWFGVQWNGTEIFSRTNLATTAWTNIQVLVTATGSSSVLQLGFQDDSHYLGLDDISLKAVASTTVRSALRNANGFHSVWNASAGAVYQLQYKTNLVQPDWINLGDAITADADSLALTDTNDLHSTSQRFYRLLKLP